MIILSYFLFIGAVKKSLLYIVIYWSVNLFYNICAYFSFISYASILVYEFMIYYKRFPTPADGSKTLSKHTECFLCYSISFNAIFDGVKKSVLYDSIASYIGVYKNLIFSLISSYTINIISSNKGIDLYKFSCLLNSSYV